MKPKIDLKMEEIKFTQKNHHKKFSRQFFRIKENSLNAKMENLERIYIKRVKSTTIKEKLARD
jgi:hypothetical protein